MSALLGANPHWPRTAARHAQIDPRRAEGMALAIGEMPCNTDDLACPCIESNWLVERRSHALLGRRRDSERGTNECERGEQADAAHVLVIRLSRGIGSASVTRTVGDRRTKTLDDDVGHSLPSMRSLSAAVIAMCVAGLLASCGGGGDDASPDVSSAVPPNSPAMQHIHGLGVRDGELYIATHTGLWIAPKGVTKARRFGNSHQDIMGFSIESASRFLGSGHPARSEQGRPPNLGLIESRDGGRTWRDISLLGRADFHVLESSGSRIYGFDGTQNRLMVSSDRGRSWRQRAAPAALYSLAIDPGNGARFIAGTQDGVFTSSTAGRTWRQVDPNLAGLLAWPASKRLYLVDGSGQVRVSVNRGRTWRPVGSIGGRPAAFTPAGAELYAALEDATVKRSADGGRSWRLRATP